MATKSKKKSKKSPEKKPAKSDVTPFRAEKEDKIDLKAIARDERTWDSFKKKEGSILRCT